MGNNGKEAKLSDILYQIEMQRQHDEVSDLLDQLPLVELENALPDIDVSLFLGEEDSDLLNDLDGGISLSSCDSDEFEQLFNGGPLKSQLPTLRKERSPRKKINLETTSKRNSTIKQEPPELEDSRQNLLVGQAHEAYSIKNEEGKKETQASHSNTDDEEMADYTFYIASKKKRNKKRKNPEYCKRRKGKPETELKIVIKRKEKQSESSNSVATNNNSKALNSAEKISSAENSDASPNKSVDDFSIWDITPVDYYSTSIAEKVKTKRRCNMKSSPETDDLSNCSKVEEKYVKKRRKISVGRKDIRTKVLQNEGFTYAKANQYIMQNNQISNKSQRTLENSSAELRTDPLNNCDVPMFSVNENNVSCNTADIISRRSPVYDRILSSRSSNFHDYSKPLPSNHCNVSNNDRGTSRCMPRLVPIAPKPVSLRSDTNHVTRSFRRMSSELNSNLTYSQEIGDVPVSMAEVEIASFEDAIEIPAESKLKQSSKSKPHFSSSSPDIPNNNSNKRPVILLTPISKKEIAMSNLRNHHTGIETSNHHAKPDSLSTVQVPILVQRQNRSKKSLLQSNTDSRALSRSQNSPEKEDIEAKRVNFDNRKAIEERRVMYVGRLPEHFTSEYIEKLFSRFGEIENVQIKVRESDSTNECGSIFDHEYGDWNLTSSLKGIDKWKKIYGFITFKRQCDVARAIEGEKMWPELKLNYGGRREFVKMNYSDLDGNFAEKTSSVYGCASKNNEDDFDFARELKAAQQRCGLGKNSHYYSKES